MFREVLKIDPKLDGAGLSQMESTLNSRFGRVARKFGGGLVGAIKSGAVAGAILGLINKFLNPLEEIQNAIEKTLHAGDDLTTYAKQFGTTPGELARVQAFGTSHGLTAEEVNQMIMKFQEALAKQALTPDEPGSVSNYMGRTDVAAAFLEFVQNMKKMGATAQELVQLDIWGGRHTLKHAEFMHQDFAETDRRLNAAGAPSTAELSQAAGHIDNIVDKKKYRDAALVMKDLVDKSDMISQGTVDKISAAEEIKRQRENVNLSKFDEIKFLQDKVDKVTFQFQQFILDLPKYFDNAAGIIADQIIKSMNPIEKARVMRYPPKKGGP